MAIQGQKRTQQEYQKWVGVFEGRVIAINPSKEELEELLGTELEKDPEYFDPNYELKDENGQVQDVVKKLNINVWVQKVNPVRNAEGVTEDDKTGPKFNIRFTLIDANRKSQAGDKFQYLNKHGISSWAVNADGLQDWIKEIGGIRIAKRGEANFYDFLRSWLMIDFKNDPEAELVLDWARLMRNDLREVKDVMNSELAGTVLCMATVRTVLDETGTHEYQAVHSQNFLPGGYIRAFRNRGRKAPKMLEKFIKEITDPEHGCSDFYVMEELRPYNSAENPAMSDGVHQEASSTVNNDDTSY